MQLGAYSLGERIGSGRLAQVYRGTDANGQPVAVKLLSPEAHMDDPAAHERFRREIDMLSRVRHPNVIALLSHGVDPELGPYLVTPLVHGMTLRELMAKGAAMPEIALLGLREIAAGIAAMHAAGVVHRDLKPENIMIQHDGQVIVIDLGLAFRADQTRYTEEGAVAGSVPYMAPEQIEAVEITPATDVWALGVIFYEWIAGTRPFQRNRPSEEVAAILSGRFTHLTERNPCATDEHTELVARCLVNDPRQRPRDAAQLAALIEAQMDWPNAQDHGRSAFKSPAGYGEKLSQFRAQSLAERAKTQMSRGQVFAATRLVERGLAYRPGDPMLLSLLDSAAKSPKTSTRSALPAVLLAVSVLALLGVVLFLVVNRDSAAVEDDSVAKTTAPALDGGTASPTVQDTPDVPAGLLNLAGLPALAESKLPNDYQVRDSVLKVYKPKMMEGLYPRRLFKGNPYSYTIGAAAGTRKIGADYESQLQLVKAHLVSYAKAKGLTLLAELATKFAKRPEVWTFRGYIETRRGEWKAADAHFTKALSLRPDDADALRQRGTLRLRLGLVRDAYKDLVAAVAADPKHVGAVRGIAELYRIAGKPTAPKRLLDAALTANPEDKDLMIDTALASKGKAARDLMDKAFRRDRSYKRALREYCLLLDRQKHTDARHKCAEAEISMYRDLDVSLAAGYANLRENRIEEAKRHFIMASVRDRTDPRGPLGSLAVHRKIHSRWFWVERYLREACQRGHKPSCTDLNKNLKSQGKPLVKPGQKPPTGPLPGVPARAVPATPAHR